MSITLTNKDRPLQIQTSLGEDVLVIQSFQGYEALSTPFRFDIEVVSAYSDLSFSAILEQPVLVTLQIDGTKGRYFHGRVRRIQQGGTTEDGYACYRLEVVPWIYFLALQWDCRIFSNQSTQEIVEAVFTKAGYSDFEFRQLTYGQRPRKYCVQYRESNLNFVQRLLEEEGIFYFFEHSDSSHKLVMADCSSQHSAFPDYPKAKIQLDESSSAPEGVIHSLYVSEEVQSAKVALTDFDFMQPSASLLTELSSQNKHEVYDYPGRYYQRSPGDEIIRKRLEEQMVGGKRIEGAGTCRFFCAGHKIELVDYFKKGVDREQVLYAVHHSAHQPLSSNPSQGGGFDYRNSFQTFPCSTSFRPPRISPKPVVRGTQTAIVTGKKGEEITTDSFGRVKVKFHWDRRSEADDTSSCWIRVAQNWAGDQFGLFCLPRIGQEVIVDFLEGDPDRPIIIGRVHNAEQMPPHLLPDHQTKSTLRSRSSKGGGGFNEFRFEDKKGSEEIYIHAEKDWNIQVNHEKNENVDDKVIETYHATQYTEVTDDVTQEYKANQKRHVAGTNTVTVDKGLKETISQGITRTVSGGIKETVSGGVGSTISGGIELDISGGATTKITGDEKQTTIGNCKIMTTGNSDATIGGNYSVSALGTTTLVFGGGATVMTPDWQVLTPNVDWIEATKTEMTGLTTEINGIVQTANGIVTEVTGLKVESVGFKKDIQVFGKEECPMKILNISVSISITAMLIIM